MEITESSIDIKYLIYGKMMMILLMKNGLIKMETSPLKNSITSLLIKRIATQNLITKHFILNYVINYRKILMINAKINLNVNY